MKERRKRKKFNIKRTLTYLATYIVVTFGVALFMVMNTSTTLSSGNKFNFTVPEPSAFERVISSITDNDNIELNATVDVNKLDEDLVDIVLGANVQFGEELTDIKVAADVQVTAANKDIYASAYFLDNMLYLSAFDGNYKLSTTSLISAAGELAQVFGVDLSGVLASLDPAALGDAANNVQEIDGGYIIVLDMMGININLIADEDYNLIKATITNVQFGDYVVDIKANVVARNNGNIVTVPDKEFVDVTDSFDIISSVAHTINSDTLFRINVASDELGFIGYVNLKDFSAYGTLSVADVTVDVAFEDKVAYISALGAKVKVDLADYAEYIEALEYFGIDTNIDMERIMDVLSNLSIDVIQSVQRVDNNVAITLTTGEQLIFDVTDDKLNSIHTTIGGVSASVDVLQGLAQLPTIDKDEYLDAKNLLKFVPTIADIVESKGVQAKVNVNYGEQSFNLYAWATFDEEVKVLATGNVFGIDLQVYYQGDNIYLDVDQAKILITTEQIGQILDLFDVDLDINGLNIALSADNDNVLVQLLDYVFTLSTNEQGIVIATDIDKLSANVTLSSYDGIISPAQGTYYPLDVVSIASQVKQLLDNKQLEVNVDTDIFDTHITAHAIVDFSDGLVVNATATAFDKDIVLVVEDGVAYITIDQTIKIQGNLSDLPKLIEDIKQALDGNSLGAIDGLKVTYNGTQFVVTYNNIEASVNVEQGLGAIVLAAQDVIVNANATLGTNESIVLVQDKDSYTNDIASLVPVVQAVKNLLDSKYIYGIARVSVGNTNLEFDVKYTHNDCINIQLDGQLLGDNLHVTYYDNLLYLDVLGLKYYLTQQDIQDILSAASNLTSMFDFDLSEITINDLVITGDVVAAIVNDDISVQIYLADGMVDRVQLYYNDIAVYLYLNYGVHYEVFEPNKTQFARLTDQFDVVSIIELAGDVIQNKQVQLDGYAVIDDKQINYGVNISFENNLMAYALVSYQDYNAYIYVQNDKLYVNALDMVYLYGDLSDLPQLIDDITQMFDVQLSLDDALDYVQYISFHNRTLQFANSDFQVIASINSNAVTVLSTDESKYTNNIAHLLPYVKAIKTLVELDSLKADVTVVYGDDTYNIDVAYVNDEGIKLSASTQLLDKDVVIKYVDDVLYLDAFGLKYYIELEDITDIIDSLDDLSLDFDLSAISISDVVINEDTLQLTINDDIVVKAYLLDNKLNSVHVVYDNINVTLALDYDSVVTFNTPQVTDYTHLTDQYDVNALIDVLQDVLDNKQVQLDGCVVIEDTRIDYYVNVAFGDALSVYATINYKDYSINAYVMDDVLYINVADILYLRGNLDELPDMIEELTTLFDAQLSLDDALDYVQYVTYHNGELVFAKDNVNAVATISGQAVDVQSTDESLYTNNIVDLLPYVKAVKTLLDSHRLTAQATVVLNEKTYTIDVTYVKDEDDNISIQLSTAIEGKDIVVTYTNSVLYLDVFGYKASINVDKDSIDEIVNQLCEVFDVQELSELLDKFNLPEIDVEQLLDALSISFNASTLNVNYDNKLSVAVNIANDVVDNVVVSYNEINAQIVLDYVNAQSITLADSYDNLNDKLDILQLARKLYNTYDAVTAKYTINGEEYVGYNAGFDASVRFGNTKLSGNVQLSVVPTLVDDKVENKLYASVYGTFGTLEAKIYLVDDTVYVNIQGLKIKAQITEQEINNILAWVNEKFDTELSIDGMGDIQVELPDLSTLSFNGDANRLHLFLNEFVVNTSRFTDIDVTLNADTLLDSILIGTTVYDGNMSEINSTEYDNDTYEDDTTIDKSLVMYLHNFAFGEFVSNITLDSDTLLGTTKTSEYVHYGKVLDFVDALIDYVNSGAYAFTLNAEVTEYNPSTNQTKLYARATDAFIELHNAKNGTTSSKINIDYLYASGTVTLPNTAKNRKTDYIDHVFSGVYDNRNGSDNKLYATYTNSQANSGNALTLKINTNVLLKFAAIALKLFDVNFGEGSTISKFANLPNVDDLDVSNLQNLLGVEPVDTTDFEEIDNMLSMVEKYLDKVKSIEFVNRVVSGHEMNYLVLNVEINDEVMELRINTGDGKLEYIEATNAQVTRARNMNLTLDVTDYKGTNNYNKSKSHFDLSTLDDLVTSLVNNSVYNDYHIKGNVTVSITLAKILPISMDIPVDVLVKVVDKKPQVLATLTIPVLHPLYNVNDDMNTWVSERTVKIYYANGYLYTYRSEKDGKYEKMVKQDISTLGSGIMDYIQYITGLNDEIMGKINEAMDKTINRTTPIDFTNVISNYSYTSSSSTHNITINLKELANNDQLDTGSVKIYTTNRSGKKYITQADLDIEMPVATGVNIAIKSGSGDKALKLVNIGSTVNISELTSFIANYKYGIDEYMEKTNGGSWKKAADAEYTITFDSLGGASVNSITNKADTNITLPTITSNKVVTVDNVQYIYRFKGWTLDSMGEGTIVNWTKQPRGNKTLYAVWELIDAKYLITFVTNSNYSVSSIRASGGAAITLPNISGVKNVDGSTQRQEYSFSGWYYDSACTNRANITTMPTNNLTLYAGWTLTRTVNIYTVSFNSNGGVTTFNSIKVESGTTPDLSSYVPHKHDTTKTKNLGTKCVHTCYTFAYWCTNSSATTRFTGPVTSNITLYAKYTTSTREHSTAFGICSDSCYGC